jgi:hypothetical protein
MSNNVDSSVGIATDCELDGQNSIPGWGTRFFSSLQRPDRLWSPPSLYPMGTGGFSPAGKATVTWSWPLTTYCQIKE